MTAREVLDKIRAPLAMVSKVLAWSLLLLILLPWTAPFKTWDLDKTSPAQTAEDWVAKEKPGAEDKLTVPSQSGSMAALQDFTEHHSHTLLVLVVEPSYRHSILRL